MICARIALPICALLLQTACATSNPSGTLQSAQSARISPPQIAGSYNPQNPFARILRGEQPSVKVYEDAHVLAFMDIHPVAPGHVLVISKTSTARNMFEVAPADLARVMAAAQLVARAEFSALGADGVSFEQNNGLWQTVFHLHVHVIPRYAQQADYSDHPPLATREELQPIAAKLAAAIAAKR